MRRHSSISYLSAYNFVVLREINPFSVYLTGTVDPPHLRADRHRSSSSTSIRRYELRSHLTDPLVIGCFSTLLSHVMHQNRYELHLSLIEAGLATVSSSCLCAHASSSSSSVRTLQSWQCSITRTSTPNRIQVFYLLEKTSVNINQLHAVSFYPICSSRSRNPSMSKSCPYRLCLRAEP